MDKIRELNYLAQSLKLGKFDLQLLNSKIKKQIWTNGLYKRMKSYTITNYLLNI